MCTENEQKTDGVEHKSELTGSAYYVDRINDYLITGGMWNPEMALHDRVSDLLIEICDFLKKPNELRLIDGELVRSDALLECPHCGCQCCCTCQYHLPVMHHCTTSPELREKHGGCCCGAQKGWACVAPGMGCVHDDWPEHSCGCELHTPNKEVSSER